MLFWAKQDRAFREHFESLHLDGNHSNFLELMKLFPRYDPILENHLKMAKDNQHSVHYLSYKIQNELIHLIASEVKRVLIKEIKDSVYYGMIFYETPDRTRREQMSRFLRYVHIDWSDKTVEIKKSFLGFVEVLGKDAKSISEAFLKSLENDGIDLDNCRFQFYDNATAMSGHISGVQKLIIDKNPRSIFTNCDSL